MNDIEYPVLACFDDILTSLRLNPITILEAPPGSGKTTILPLEILNSGIFSNKKILILEPRRIAAKNAALRMSVTSNNTLGETIGYRIRFETRVSKSTKIELVTDGIFTKILLVDPELSEYGLIIFDEFHERNLDSDYCLALTRRSQSLFRDDLRILIMSATLDGINFKKGGISIPPITSSGKSYPVEIFYQGSSDKRLSARLTDLIPKICLLHEGDILIFFSGIAEINEAENQLLDSIRQTKLNLQVFRLFGEMNFELQQSVFLPGKVGFRKVILATNLAESSVTIPNVRIVVDSGYCKRVFFDPSSGLTKLEKKRISLASAKQRSGRAGREAKGITYRLWSKDEELNFLEAHPPEILEGDVSKLILLSKIWGEELLSLPLLDFPSAGIVKELNDLLCLLGCLDADQKITPLGKETVSLPLPIRIATMCILFSHDKTKGFISELAAVYTERRILSDQNQTLNFYQIWEKWLLIKRNHPYPKLEQVRDQILELLPDSHSTVDKFVSGNTTSPGLALSFAYPDRISKLRKQGSLKYKMANGKGLYFREGLTMQAPEWIVALETDGNTTDAKIMLYIEISELEVLKYHKILMHKKKVVSLEEIDKKGTILREVEEHLFGDILLKRIPAKPGRSEAKVIAIRNYLLKEGIVNILSEDQTTKQFLLRVECLKKHGWNFPDISEASLIEDFESWLLPFYPLEKPNFYLKEIDFYSALLSRFTYEQKETINREAPVHITVPSGSKISILYTEEDAVLSVKLQELFGLGVSPKIASGKVSLTLHLLSPGGKPVQITKDLKRFWDHTYLEVKKELKGRYPRHPWPDSPWEATPFKGTKKRMLN